MKRPAGGASSWRPRGWTRHALGVLAPRTLLIAGRVALERDAATRTRRLTDTVQDSVGERVRPSRARMRTLMVFPGGRLRWREVPAPPLPGPLGALVRPVAVATCDVDRPLALGATPFPLPLRLGHECVAEVVAVGDRVAGVAPGQRVVVPFQISCGGCRSCQTGHTANCAGVPPISMYGFGVAGGHWGGALSDLLAVPYADGMLVPVPSGIDPATVASVADTVCDGYRHVAPHLPGLLRRDPDCPVLIVAAVDARSPFTPSTALYAGLTARALGARNVAVADARACVRGYAERLGLTSARPADLLRGRLGAPLVVDVSASPAGLRAALGATAPDGVCSSAGGLYPSMRLPLGLLYGRNATLHVGRTHTRALIPAVLALVAGGGLRPQDVTSGYGRLDDAPQVLAEHFFGGGVKTVLTVDGSAP